MEGYLYNAAVLTAPPSLPTPPTPIPPQGRCLRCNNRLSLSQDHFSRGVEVTRTGRDEDVWTCLFFLSSSPTVFFFLCFSYQSLFLHPCHVLSSFRILSLTQVIIKRMHIITNIACRPRTTVERRNKGNGYERGPSGGWR